MRRRFKAKKRKKIFLKLLSTVIIFCFTFSFIVIFLLDKLVINLNNEKVVSYILNNNEINLDKLNTPEFIFSYAFGYEFLESEPVIKEEDTPIVINNPLVYIYNTHTTEEYTYESFEAFNINPTVITASYIFKEYLKDEEIYAVVEENNPVDILRANSWSYSKSYDASRFLLEDAITNYPTINYYIDIHRDSASYDITTVNIDGKQCARFMFIVGEDNPTFSTNLELSNKLNDELNKIHPNFTRGVLGKSGSNVNGIYNQDLHLNAILIEVGGQYNSIEEVNCSLAYLAESFRKVVNSG